MEQIKWDILKEKLLLLSESPNPIEINRLGLIVDEKLFIKSQIAVVDSSIKEGEMNNREKHFKLYIAKPAYDRLLLYYYFKTTIETSFC